MCGIGKSSLDVLAHSDLASQVQPTSITGNQETTRFQCDKIFDLHCTVHWVWRSEGSWKVTLLFAVWWLLRAIRKTSSVGLFCKGCCKEQNNVAHLIKKNNIVSFCFLADVRPSWRVAPDSGCTLLPAVASGSRCQSWWVLKHFSFVSSWRNALEEWCLDCASPDVFGWRGKIWNLWKIELRRFLSYGHETKCITFMKSSSNWIGNVWNRIPFPLTILPPPSTQPTILRRHPLRIACWAR